MNKPKIENIKKKLTPPHYDLDYQNLPSEYAAYGRDDDRAET